jgi:quercetin dioxygenase-like cupin family protein
MTELESITSTFNGVMDGDATHPDDRRRQWDTGRHRIPVGSASTRFGAKENDMDVRSARDVAPVIEHAGTVPVWWLVQPDELHESTRGGFLELVSEWEVAGGGLVDPHQHPTHEFYYIISGRGIMNIAGEEREVGQGDLIRIPPDTVHSIWPLTEHTGLRGLAFAIGIEGSGPVNYTD